MLKNAWPGILKEWSVSNGIKYQESQRIRWGLVPGTCYTMHFSLKYKPNGIIFGGGVGCLRWLFSKEGRVVVF